MASCSIQELPYQEEKLEVDFNNLVKNVIDLINPPKNIEIEIKNNLLIILCEATA